MKIAGFAAENMASSHLRVRQWIDALKKRGHVAEFHGDTIMDLSTIDAKLAGCDAVIYGRTHDINRVVALQAARKVHGFKLIVDTDDLVDNIPAHNFASRAFNNSTGLIRIANGQYRDADAVTCSTQYLADHTRKITDAVYYVPNVVDTNLWNGVRTRNKEARHAGDIRIYWGGGGGHYDDLLIVKDALLRIVREHANVKLVFSNFVPDWAASLPWNRVFFLPLVPFELYPRILTHLCIDIGLAPLIDHPFNQAKSHVKWLDYAMAGIPGVYQDIDAYDAVVERESSAHQTGLLATTPEHWYEQISALVADAALRQRIAINARDEVTTKWTVEQHDAAYERMLQRITRPPVVVSRLVEGEAIACQTL